MNAQMVVEMLMTWSKNYDTKQSTDWMKERKTEWKNEKNEKG